MRKSTKRIYFSVFFCVLFVGEIRHYITTMSSRGKKGKKGKDSKFFSSSTKKGELREINDELCSPKLSVQRDAIKRVIALMTVGKDVSMLFPQVVNCMQTCT